MPIEQVSPEMERIVSPDQELELLGSGLGVPGRLPAEGPLWWKEGGYLLFSDMGNDRTMKWAPGEGVSVFREPTNQANGLTRDLQGRLIGCEHSARRVTRLEQDGSVTVVADRYEGKLLNRPNDVVVKSDGSIYFTDPISDNVETELGYAGVFRVSPDLSAITLVAQDFDLPNGLAFSPDESVLYVDDSGAQNIRAFDVRPGDGMLTNDRLFCDMRGQRPGVPDGMKVDVEGNVYCTASGGVWVVDASGKHLGTILTGTDQTTNCAWGGEDWRTLFITTFETLVSIRLNISGIPVPP